MGKEEKRERDKILTITIDNFTEYVQLSKARRSKPYIKDKCRVPKKYSGVEYGWLKKGKYSVLVHIESGETLVANSKLAGTPRLKKGNGQDIYNGNVTRQSRATLVRAIHNYFAPYISKTESIEGLDKFPLTLEILYYVHDKGKNNIDNDNKWIWRKGIQDTFVELGKIKDDNPNFINRNEEETILIPDDEEQKLIINIYSTHGLLTTF